MLLNAEREVALLIELALLEAATCCLEGYNQKILSCFAPQGQLGTYGLILLDPEVGQSLLGNGSNRLLLGNGLHDGLGVDQPLAALAYAYMHHYLVHARDEIGVHLTAPSLITGSSLPIM